MYLLFGSFVQCLFGYHLFQIPGTIVDFHFKHSLPGFLSELDRKDEKPAEGLRSAG